MIIMDIIICMLNVQITRIAAEEKSIDTAKMKSPLMC